MTIMEMTHRIECASLVVFYVAAVEVMQPRVRVALDDDGRAHCSARFRPT